MTWQDSNYKRTHICQAWERYINQNNLWYSQILITVWPINYNIMIVEAMNTEIYFSDSNGDDDGGGDNCNKRCLR